MYASLELEPELAGAPIEATLVFFMVAMAGGAPRERQGKWNLRVLGRGKGKGPCGAQEAASGPRESGRWVHSYLHGDFRFASLCVAAVCEGDIYIEQSKRKVRMCLPVSRATGILGLLQLLVPMREPVLATKMEEGPLHAKQQ